MDELDGSIKTLLRLFVKERQKPSLKILKEKITFLLELQRNHQSPPE